MKKTAAIILAGGKGTRMKSRSHKVLHKVGGKPLIFHALNNLNQAEIKEIIVVVSHNAHLVKAAISKEYNCTFAYQEEPLGTGHAVKVALAQTPKEIDTIVVMNGDDSAFYRPSTFQNLVSSFKKSGREMLVLTSHQKKTDVPSRVMRDENSNFLGFKPAKDMTYTELKTNNEVVCGLFVFNRQWLVENLPKVEKGSNGEYNLPTLIRLARAQDTISTFTLADSREWQGVNDRAQLAKARRIWNKFHK